MLFAVVYGIFAELYEKMGDLVKAAEYSQRKQQIEEDRYLELSWL